MDGVFGRFVCSCLFLLGLWGLSTVGLSGCLFVFPSPPISGLVSGFFLVVFSVGHEWSMLRLGGSGVLSQGAGYGIFGVCFLFSSMRQFVEIHSDLSEHYFVHG